MEAEEWPVWAMDQAERFVPATLLGYVQEWPFQPLPKGYRQMKQGACFRNAAILVQRDPSLCYCEGVAGPIVSDLVPHAWAVDQNGRVIDPTWCRRHEGKRYFGIPLTTEWIFETARESGHGGESLRMLARRIKEDPSAICQWIKRERLI